MCDLPQGMAIDQCHDILKLEQNVSTVNKHVIKYER